MSSSPGRSSRGTPRRPRTPRSRGDAEFIVEPSDPYSLPISTPGGLQGQTSPIRMSGDENLSSPLNYGTPSSVFSSLRTPRSMTRNTPLRGRADIAVDKRIRQVNIQSEADVVSSETDRNEPTLVIWGTDVVVTRCKTKFRNFVENFVGSTSSDPKAAVDQIEKIYLNDLDAISQIEVPFLNVNCAHLEQFDLDLYKQLVNYPQEVIPAFDMAANELFFQRHPDVVLPHQIQVRPFNAEKTQNMRSLNPEDIDKLITISGMVIRTSNIIPEMREAFFMCSVCHLSRTVEVDRGRIAEPTLCTNCNTNHCFNLVHNRSQFTDKQLVKLQESPDDMPAGQTPHTVTLFAHNDLVDGVTPGQRVSVTGIYRAIPYQVNPRMRNLKSVYRTHIDVLHYYRAGAKFLHETDSEYNRFTPTAEQLEVLKALSQRPDLYERLANSIAPSIYENEDIKKGILLQLFGGTRKTYHRSGRTSFRSEINVLLCGDPGTSKSQLLTYVYNLVPKSQYTSGKGSSAVGLTAYVTKDPESRQLVLQTGALVLADNGVCCIDEFDKMNDATRSVLHEVMEQQTLSIAKAGIICQLNARTSILAAANPVESEWNKNKTIIENIKLPHTLLSRFDLIFLVLDPQSEHYDRKLAKHLVSLYYHSKEKEDDELMDRMVLRDYITYARDNIHPTLSELAGEHLVHAYVDMRRVGSGRGQISAYPRQLESLIRLSEAHAKMRLSPEVELQDVQEAQRLHREALKQSATDPLSGKIDVNILTTGLSMAARKKKQEIVDALRALITKKGYASTLPYQKVFKELKESVQMVIPRDMFDEALKDMQEEGILKVSARQTIKLL